MPVGYRKQEPREVREPRQIKLLDTGKRTDSRVKKMRTHGDIEMVLTRVTAVVFYGNNAATHVKRLLNRGNLR